jgi:tRNA pseudouridine38-40 synthase
MMNNYKMVLAYDGSRYSGWQKLGKGELTIQGILEQTLKDILGTKIEIQGSGRTDAGVHARGQVANFKTVKVLQPIFRDVLNEKLPEDIRVLALEKVSGSFHSRYSAKAKRYKYYVDTNEKANVFQRKYTCQYPKKLDFDNIRKAAMYLCGTHDFSSFTDDKSEKDKVRTISQIEITEEKGILCFTYDGDGFLQHMVRILTGTLLEVGSGEKAAEDIPKTLEAKERAQAGFMVPAKGLFLDKVEY